MKENPKAQVKQSFLLAVDWQVLQFGWHLRRVRVRSKIPQLPTVAGFVKSVRTEKVRVVEE